MKYASFNKYCVFTIFVISGNWNTDKSRMYLQRSSTIDLHCDKVEHYVLDLIFIFWLVQVYAWNPLGVKRDEKESIYLPDMTINCENTEHLLKVVFSFHSTKWL